MALLDMSFFLPFIYDLPCHKAVSCECNGIIQSRFHCDDVVVSNNNEEKKRIEQRKEEEKNEDMQVNNKYEAFSSLTFLFSRYVKLLAYYS